MDQPQKTLTWRLWGTAHPTGKERAEACFLRAIEIACKQQAKSWELRAVTTLARLGQQLGKKTEARQLLSPIYHWFTEGFDTKDLQKSQGAVGRTGVDWRRASSNT